ncbi:MAG: OmpA family protein [Bacteroidota bacterium]|nr:OmpA family protein [Bacteroidota bacterium]
MKRIIFIITLASFAVSAFSQDSKEIKEAFLDGEYFLAYEAYLDALPFYQIVYDQDQDNANINYKIGLCYVNMANQKEKSIAFLEKAITNVTDDYKEGNYKEVRAPQEAFFFLATAYHIQNQFEKAKKEYAKYLNLLPPADTVNINFVNQQITACDNADNMIQNRVYFEAVNLGKKINTDSNEFDAVVSNDGSTMVVVSKQKFYDALFFLKNRNGVWGSKINITPDIKSDGDHYPTGLSNDGKILLLTWNDKFNSDIFISQYINGKWTPAEKMDKPINTKYWESHASFSPDGNTIYFTSNRPGGYGGLDIYKTLKNADTEEWGLPENLGPVINTQFNEETPFICNDNKTLYFSSQGHSGMGGFDSFYSVFNDDGTFTKPQNLGYPLNTSDDDIFFFPLQGGKNAYLSRADFEDNIGRDDIYFLEIFSDSNPRQVEIKGNISLESISSINKDQVKIWIGTNKPETSQIFFAQSPEGKYFTTSNIPGNYRMLIEADGYIAETRPFVIPDNYSVGEIVIDINLKATQIKPIVLGNIYFAFNSTTISANELNKVKSVLVVLNENPDLILEVAGHTDAIGSDAYNKRLSNKRANSVIDFLLKNGIEKQRMKAKAYGESSFIAINNHNNGSDAPKGREFNRRVEFHVIKTSNNAIIGEKVEIPANLKIIK